MTTSTPTNSHHRSSEPGRPRRRTGSTVVAVVLVLGAVGLAMAGAYATVVRSGGSYIDLGAQGDYETNQFGLVTENTDWDTFFLGWAGSVQVEVAPEGAGPIFVGAASPGTVDPYLARVGHTIVAERSGGGVAHIDHDGGAPVMPASTAVDWTARSEGAGVQTLRWQATDGPQTIVAMSADGSRGVEVQVVSSAVTLDRMPWWVPTGMLAASAILLVSAFGIFRRGRRAA